MVRNILLLVGFPNQYPPHKLGCEVLRMKLRDLKYKDELPIKTINRIRCILGELGILTIEMAWQNSVEGFYSVSVVIPNTSLTTNGKGTSYEYALASAYGELMERLQNQAAFRLGFDVSPRSLQYMKFYYAPDEIYMTMDEIVNSTEEWLIKQFARITAVDKGALLTLWQSVSYEDVPADFITLPYVNLGNHHISHIPIKMISKMYMSNGMCAGNTPEEALVQGISEILERYVTKQVIQHKVVPPAIPREYIAKFPSINAMLSSLEASGNFHVIIKDCSLQQELPVVGVICINKSDQSYFVRFGAHPIFEIALERTLTELLQGQDIHRMIGVREFSYKNESDQNSENMMGILVNGSGIYPTEFFGGGYNRDFQGFVNPPGAGNKELLLYLVDLLARQEYDVFIRDVSYLGFPSFHIIVPGLSEITEFDDVKSIADYADYNKVKRLIRNSGGFKGENGAEIIRLLEKINYDHEISVLELLQLPVKGNKIPWYYANLNLFMMALYYQTGDLVKAHLVFSRFLANMKSDAGPQVYQKCVRDYLGALSNEFWNEEILSILEAFYPHEIVQGVMNEFGDPERMMSHPWLLNCWQCEKCPFGEHCLYPSTENVYKKLKEQYATHPLDQHNLKSILTL